MMSRKCLCYGNSYESDTDVSTAISRMQFLRGDYSGRNNPIRPPWALAENTFINLCETCGDCADKCPTHIIHQGRGKFPVIDFKSGECLLCGDCVDACKPGALQKTDGQQPWSVTASINSKTCLAYNNVECRSCYDPCESHAINMTPRIGGVSIPLLNANSCTGCGACFAVCPVQAVQMNTNKFQESR